MAIKQKITELEDIQVLDYNPTHRYILVVSGDALEKGRAEMLVDFLDEMGAHNVAVIWTEPGVNPKEVIDFIDMPSPWWRVVLYWAKTLWQRIPTKTPTKPRT